MFTLYYTELTFEARTARKRPRPKRPKRPKPEGAALGSRQEAKRRIVETFNAVLNNRYTYF